MAHPSRLPRQNATSSFGVTSRRAISPLSSSSATPTSDNDYFSLSALSLSLSQQSLSSRPSSREEDDAGYYGDSFTTPPCGDAQPRSTTQPRSSPRNLPAPPLEIRPSSIRLQQQLQARLQKKSSHLDNLQELVESLMASQGTERCLSASPPPSSYEGLSSASSCTEDNDDVLKEIRMTRVIPSVHKVKKRAHLAHVGKAIEQRKMATQRTYVRKAVRMRRRSDQPRD
ncbi:MAG: hypothetical protein M1833_003612 [Piccolia ochrophora]|nr:MAG: hypothetical protein M1833_003612 [Piccolia ochrophora]